MAVATEKCENCGGVIGALETPMLYDGHVVCAICHAKLAAQSTASIEDISEEIREEAERAYRPKSIHSTGFNPGKDIICPNPNCGYRGPGKTTSSSLGCAAVAFIFVGIGLLFVGEPAFNVAAFLMFIAFLVCLVAWLASPVQKNCPRCGIRAR